MKIRKSLNWLAPLRNTRAPYFLVSFLRKSRESVLISSKNLEKVSKFLHENFNKIKNSLNNYY